MARSYRVCSFLFILFVLLNIPLLLYAQEGEIVQSIIIKGNKRIVDSTVLFYIKSKVGEPLSRRQIRKDIEQIYSLGQFKDIRVETQQVSKGLELVFIVEEIPSVGSVEVLGTDNVEPKDIMEKIGLKRGATFNDPLVQESIEQITQLYHDKGYFFVGVKINGTLNQENQIDTIIRIKEGGKVSIEKIRFIGNKAFKDKELHKVIETSESGWLSFFTDSGIYKKDVLKIDLLRVESYYHDHGYLKVRVLEPKINIDRKAKEIHITIPVEEGFQYRLGEVHVEEDETFTAKELRAALKVKPGEIYSMSEIREDILNLTELYSQKGFAYADVSPLTKINDETKTVDLTIKADKGRKVFVGQINIRGNLKTRDNVIRREFRFQERELFNSAKLRRSRQRINNLGFFQDVKIDTRPGKEPDLINIDATVTEKPTGSFNVGAGFSSVENAILNASVSQNNFLGRGQRLIFSFQLSSLRTNFNFSFTDPRIFNSRISAGVDLFKQRSNQLSFISDTSGGGFRFGKAVGENDWVGLNYRLENVEVSDVDPLDETEFLMNREQTTSRIIPTFIRDTRDDFLNPTRGWRHVVRLELAGLGGTKFVRTNYKVSYFHPLFWKLVLGTNAEINWADGYGDDVLPAFERFFMGGANSLRGFTIRDIGPKNFAGDPLGGDQSLLFNVELVYPLTRTFRAFVFYDRGNVFGEGFDTSTTATSFDLGEMRQSFGAGIRFFSPFGPIGLAYGIKLDRRSFEKTGEFHFSAGGAF